MKPYYEDASVTLHHGDCIEVLRQLDDDSVDAVVTDPPYGLEFMGKGWDGADGFRRSLNAADTGRDNAFGRTSRTSPEYRAGSLFQEWCEAWAAECLRVLKPGGHMLAFGGSRTWHRLAVAVEDAGFEIRDSIAWLYGNGFPKSLDVSKAIDKGNGKNRARQLEFTTWMRSTGITPSQINAATQSFMGSHYLTDRKQAAIATADMFDQLRPLLPEVPEQIERLVAERTGIEWTDYVNRPVVRQVKRTGKESGTYGAFAGDNVETNSATETSATWQGWGTALKPAFEPIVVGRKPLAGTVAANVLKHGTGALNIAGCRTEAIDDQLAAKYASVQNAGPRANSVYGTDDRDRAGAAPHDLGRWPTNVVIDGTQAELRDAAMYFPTFRYEAKASTDERPNVDGVAHPTVKPLDLMQWLVRLVTPPGGTVLEPFAGSGTTAEACVVEGFRCIAIERDETYLPLIIQRLTKPIQVGLDFGSAS